MPPSNTALGKFWESNLYSPVTFLPPTLDGFLAVQRFETMQGAEYLAELQKLTEAHLKLLSQVCHMSDSAVMLLEDPGCSKERKNELMKVQRQTMTAIKTVDKPNIHRLRELVYTSLPMIVHATRFGELVFEKTHQLLKRVILISNNRDIQF